MAFDADLVTRLKAVAAAAGKKDCRVSWFELPRGEWPYAVLLTPAGVGEIWTHEGLNALSEPRVQIDVYAVDQTVASLLARAIRANLQQPVRVTVGETVFLPPAPLNLTMKSTEQIGGTESAAGRKVYREMLDFNLYTQPAA